MKRLIEFDLEDGGSILVQVEEPEPAGGVVRAGRTYEVIAKAEQTFESAMEKIKPAAMAAISAISKLRDLTDIDPPDARNLGIQLRQQNHARRHASLLALDGLAHL